MAYTRLSPGVYQGGRGRIFTPRSGVMPSPQRQMAPPMPPPQRQPMPVGEPQPLPPEASPMRQPQPVGSPSPMQSEEFQRMSPEDARWGEEQKQRWNNITPEQRQMMRDRFGGGPPPDFNMGRQGTVMLPRTEEEWQQRRNPHQPMMRQDPGMRPDNQFHAMSADEEARASGPVYSSPEQRQQRQGMLRAAYQKMRQPMRGGY